MALVLALSSNAALALGLGDIRVLSRPGQPLLAEIPVVSADPGELEAAQVALASPATFARVGLERPSGLISTLQFGFASDAQGRAVIRVTSPAPVDVPVVSFLIEVDWGRGRLVREYSALVDRPHTAQAIDAPQIQAPSLAPSNAIVREPAPAPAPAAAVPAPAPAPAPAAAAPARAIPAVATGMAPAPALSALDGPMTVQSGQTLSQIAIGLARGTDANLEQTMVALLQANPQAFIGGNIHRLRSGAQLELPDAQALASVGAAQARAIVREQTGQWQQARAPMPQPAVAGSAADATKEEAANATATTGARLEIAPATAVDGAATASVSGTQAGAQGDMLVSEQLRQAHEDLATRDAELAELRERVAELEKLREQQSALIELQDNEMATAQKQVADSGAVAASEGGAGWLWGGGLLLVGAAVAAWLARRRKPLPPAPAIVGDDDAGIPDAQGDTVPVELADRDDHPVQAPSGVDAEQMIAALRDQRAPLRTPAAEAAPVAAAPALSWPTASAPAERAQAPVAHAADEVFDPFQLPLHERGGVAEVEPEVEVAPVQPPVQGVPADMPWSADAAPVVPASLPLPGSRERLELAIAYLDLGDAQTARSLLEEVVTAGDAAARAQALELLGRLG